MHYRTFTYSFCEVTTILILEQPKQKKRKLHTILFMTINISE